MPIVVKVDVRDAITRLGNFADGLASDVAWVASEKIFRMTRRSFDTQTSPEGARWAPLSPRYGAAKMKLFPGRPILQAHGTLLRSLFRSVEGNATGISVITVGSSLVYAAAHQFGFSGAVSVAQFVRRQRSRDVFAKTPGAPGGKAYRRKVGEGIAHVGAHTGRRNIPARPFLPNQETAEAVALQAAQEIVEDRIHKAGLK